MKIASVMINMEPFSHIALATSLLAATHSVAPSNADVVGAWVCGPYEMQQPDMVISAIDRPIYTSDGSFSSSGEATYILPDGTETRVELQHVGKWSLTGDIIEIKYSSVKVVSTDSPILTIETAQASLDATRKRKDWVKKRILKYGERLVTIVVDPIHEQAAVEVSCKRV